MSRDCGPGTVGVGGWVSRAERDEQNPCLHEAYVLAGWQDKTRVISRSGENANKTG